MTKTELMMALDLIPGDPRVVDPSGNELIACELSDFGEGDVVCMEFE